MDFKYLKCTNPILAVMSNKRDRYRYMGFDEGVKPSVKIIGNLKNIEKVHGTNFALDLYSQDGIIKLPCRHCYNCQMKRAREWAMRCTLESYEYDENELYFLTLTYDNDNIYEIKKFRSLSKQAITKFMKDLRNNFKKAKISYFACGEYGSKTCRPHYHMLLYGLKIPDLDELYEYNGNKYYKSEIIEKIWSKGFVNISNFSPYTANYTAQYCVKKINTDEIKNNVIQPEFIQMSRNPTIGLCYFNNHKDKIYEDDGFLYHTDYKTIKARPFQIYDRHYDQERPEHLKFLKDNRKKFLKEYDYLSNEFEKSISLREWLDNIERVNYKERRLREYGESNTKKT